MDPYCLKRLWRRPWLTACGIVITMLLCVLMGYMSDYLQNQEAKLTEAQESFEIRCVITNQRGTKAGGLRMDSSVSNFLMDEDSPMAPYIRDLRITKEFVSAASGMGIPALEAQYSLFDLIGVNCAQCDEKLDPARNGSVTHFTEDFYDQLSYICLVSEEVYQQLQASHPDQEEFVIRMNVTDPYVEFKPDSDLGKGTVDFRVAGFYAGTGTDVFIPFPTSQHLATYISMRASSDSASFYVVDNLKLDELSEAASEMFGSVDPLSEEDGLALVIYDEQYRSTVAVLEQNIQRTSLLLPVVMLLGLGVGFLISYLATRNERKTYALMRTVGMNAKKLFFSVLREQLIPVIIGALIGSALSRELLPTAVYLLCYGVGCTVCITKSIQVPPTAILREQE